MTMPAAGAPEHHPYRVLSQTKRRTLINGQTWGDAYEVTFRSAKSGTIATVEIPAEHYTPAYVDQVIEAELDNVEGVHQLGPQPHPDNIG